MCLWILRNITTISKLPWRGPHDTHLKTWNYTFCIFFFFIRKLYSETNKLLLITNLHNIFLSPIFIFKNATSNNLLNDLFFSLDCNGVHGFSICTNSETIRCLMMVVVCLRFFHDDVVVVVGWCHLKFFWYNIFVYMCDRSQNMWIRSEFPYFLRRRRWHFAFELVWMAKVDRLKRILF